MSVRTSGFLGASSGAPPDSSLLLALLLPPVLATSCPEAAFLPFFESPFLFVNSMKLVSGSFGLLAAGFFEALPRGACAFFGIAAGI